MPWPSKIEEGRALKKKHHWRGCLAGADDNSFLVVATSRQHFLLTNLIFQTGTFSEKGRWKLPRPPIQNDETITFQQKKIAKVGLEAQVCISA